MDISLFTDGKITVKHYSENGKQVVKIENSKTKNTLFYRGDSINRAKQIFSDVVKWIQKNQE